MTRSTTILKKAAFLIPPLALLIAVAVVLLVSTPLVIFPHPDYRNRITTYADSELSGNSKIIDFTVLENKIVLTYTLGRNDSVSFAGLFFDLSILDVSAYDDLELRLDVTSPARYRVTFMSFIEGRTRLSELNTIAHSSQSIELISANHVYTIGLDELMNDDVSGRATAQSQASEKPARILFLHLKEFVETNRETPPDAPYYTTKTVIIECVSFSRNHTVLLAAAAIVIAVYFALYVLFVKFGKNILGRRENGNRQDLPSVQLNVETYREADTKKIMEIIREFTFESDFSIHTVNRETGLSEQKISQLIEDQYGMSFKQFMNQIRLNEAKRLLLESDLKVFDISYKIGYNDNTYFCKLFKKQFGLAPNEWRKRNLKQEFHERR